MMNVECTVDKDFPACQDRELVARMYSMERELHVMRIHVDTLNQKMSVLSAWAEADRVKSAWFYDNQTDIKSLIESKRWASITRHVVAWVMGAILSAVVFWNTVWPLFNNGE
jgi:hypothetical protein